MRGAMCCAIARSVERGGDGHEPAVAAARPCPPPSPLVRASLEVSDFVARDVHGRKRLYGPRGQRSSRTVSMSAIVLYVTPGSFASLDGAGRLGGSFASLDGADLSGGLSGTRNLDTLARCRR